VTDRNDDLGRRLRNHYAALPAVPPSDVVDAARDRIAASGRQPRSWLVRLAAVAAIASIVASAVVMSGAFPGPLPQFPSPSSSPLASSSEPAASPTIAKGTVAEVVKPFSIVSDRGVLVGQRVYVVDGPTPYEGKPSYLIQHWGDLDSGLRPNSDFGWIGREEALASLRPVAIDCPTRPPTLSAIAALQPFERLVCLGGREIELGPVTTRAYEVGASSGTWLSSDGSVDFPIAIPYIAPSIAALDSNRWYRVAGHFDDPGCEREGDAVASTRCRQQFVLTGATESDAPAIFLGGTWRRIAESPLSGRTGSTFAWSGSEVLIWGGDAFDGVTSQYIPDGGAYDPVADRWRRLPAAPIGGRLAAFGAWTGRQFLVWGGYERNGDVETQMVDGALFNPATDRWELLPPAPLEKNSAAATAIWIGSELVVFSAGMRSGAALDVATRRWRAISPPPLDSGETNSPALVWSGTELIALGYPVDDVDTSMAWAAAWDPVTDHWRTLSDPGFRSMQGGPATWTGREIIVLWGANRAFDPAKGTWRPINNACGAGAGHAWTGRYSIEFGRAFDTVTETCRNMPAEPERPGGGYREFGVEVWTGQELIRWSGGNGLDGAPRANDGVAFVPTDDLTR
jgi:hypothetical protein